MSRQRRPKPYSLSQFNLDKELPDRPPVYNRLDDDLVEAIHAYWLPTLPPIMSVVIDSVVWGKLPLRETAILLATQGLTNRVLDPKDVARLRDRALSLLRPLVEEWAYATKNADLIRRHQLAVRRGVWVT
jgi:hypothetical protein